MSLVSIADVSDAWEKFCSKEVEFDRDDANEFEDEDDDSVLKNDKAFPIFVRALFDAIADSGTATLRTFDLFHGHVFKELCVDSVLPDVSAVTASIAAEAEKAVVSSPADQNIAEDGKKNHVDKGGPGTVNYGRKTKGLGILFHAKEYPKEYATGLQILPVGHSRAGGMNDPRMGTTLSISDKDYPNRNFIWSSEIDPTKVFIIDLVGLAGAKAASSSQTPPLQNDGGGASQRGEPQSGGSTYIQSNHSSQSGSSTSGTNIINIDLVSSPAHVNHQNDDQNDGGSGSCGEGVCKIPFPDVHLYFVPGVAGRRYFTISEYRIGRKQLGIVSYFPDRHNGEVQVQCLGMDKNTHVFECHENHDTVDEDGVPVSKSGLPYFLACRFSTRMFESVLQRPKSEAVTRAVVEADPEYQTAQLELLTESILTANPKIAARVQVVSRELVSDFLYREEDVRICISANFAARMAHALCEDEQKADENLTTKSDVLSNKEVLESLLHSLSVFRLDKILRVALEKYRRPGDDVLNEAPAIIPWDLAVGILETSPWITNDVPLAIKCASVVLQSALWKSLTCGTASSSPAKRIEALSGHCISMAENGGSRTDTMKIRSKDNSHLRQQIAALLADMEALIQMEKDKADATSERRFQFAIHEAKANCCDEHAQLRDQFLGENIGGSPSGENTNAQDSQKNASGTVGAENLNLSCRIATSESEEDGKAWLVLVGGEYGGVMVSDPQRTRPGKYLGGHCSLQNIGICYEKMVPWFGPERIIVIAQLRETLEWLEEATENYEACIRMTGKNSPELFETLKRRLEETRRDCRVLLENGGADYDYDDVNVLTLMRVLKGESVDTSGDGVIGTSGRKTSSINSRTTQKRKGKVLPPHPSSILLLINTHGNTHPTGASNAWDEWYCHFPYPCKGPDADAIYSIAATQGFQEEQQAVLPSATNSRSVSKDSGELQNLSSAADKQAATPKATPKSGKESGECDNLVPTGIGNKAVGDPATPEVGNSDQVVIRLENVHLETADTENVRTSDDSVDCMEQKLEENEALEETPEIEISPKTGIVTVGGSRSESSSDGEGDDGGRQKHSEDGESAGELVLVVCEGGTVATSSCDGSKNPDERESAAARGAADTSTAKTDGTKDKADGTTGVGPSTGAAASNRRVDDGSSTKNTSERLTRQPVGGNTAAAAASDCEQRPSKKRSEKNLTTPRRRFVDWGAPKYRFRLYSQQLFQCLHDITARNGIDHSFDHAEIRNAKERAKKGKRKGPCQIICLFQFCLSGGFTNFLTLPSYRRYFDTPRWPVFVMATSEKYESALGVFMNLWIAHLDRHLKFSFSKATAQDGPGPGDAESDTRSRSRNELEVDSSDLKRRAMRIKDLLPSLKELFDQVREKYYRHVCNYDAEKTNLLVNTSDGIAKIADGNFFANFGGSFKAVIKEPITVGTLNCHSGMKTISLPMEDVSIETMINITDGTETTH